MTDAITGDGSVEEKNEAYARIASDFLANELPRDQLPPMARIAKMERVTNLYQLAESLLSSQDDTLDIKEIGKLSRSTRLKLANRCIVIGVSSFAQCPSQDMGLEGMIQNVVDLTCLGVLINEGAKGRPG